MFISLEIVCNLYQELECTLANSVNLTQMTQHISQKSQIFYVQTSFEKFEGKYLI